MQCKSTDWFIWDGNTDLSSFNNIKVNLNDYIHILMISVLIHFMPLVSFYTPWKHQKTRCFVMFLGGNRKKLVVWNELIPPWPMFPSPSTVSAPHSSGGQISFPKFENGGIRKKSTCGKHKRVPATDICLFFCLEVLVKFFSAWGDIKNCWFVVCKRGQYQGWHYILITVNRFAWLVSVWL